jgi:hypothetical protein
VKKYSFSCLVGSTGGCKEEKFKKDLIILISCIRLKGQMDSSITGCIPKHQGLGVAAKLDLHRYCPRGGGMSQGPCINQ